MKLRDYQEEAIIAIQSKINVHDKVLVVMATGLGKTVVFANYLAQQENKKVLVLAHRTSLLFQAEKKFSIWYPNYKESCTICSIQYMSRNYKKYAADDFDIIVIDEAHHALSKGYQKVLSYFSSAKVLGVTATPQRTDKKDIMSYFDTIAFSRDIDWGIKNGYLSPVNILRLPVDINLGKVKEIYGDLDTKGVDEEVSKVLSIIIEKAAPKISSRKTVVFLPSIRSAELAAELFNSMGIKAKALHSKQSFNKRMEVIKGFENNDFSVLCNAIMLTEGFDCPDVDCIINLRATTSISLYQQIIGRGLRLADGKKNCLVLDFLWHSDKYSLVTPESVVGETAKVYTDFNIVSKKSTGNESEKAFVERVMKLKNKSGAIVVNGVSYDLASSYQIKRFVELELVKEDFTCLRRAANQATIMIARHEPKDKIKDFLLKSYLAIQEICI